MSNLTHSVAAALVLSMCLSVPAQEGVQEVKSDTGVHETKPIAPAPQAAESNAWFPVVRQDFGTYFNDEKAKGKFAFKNPTDVEQKLTNIAGSCSCTRAEFRLGERLYLLDKDPQANSLHRVTKQDGQEVKERVSHITIGPGEAGEIEVQMEMHGVRGPKEATLDFETTDTETPHVKLSWRATGAIYFEVNPPDVNLNEMTWNDKRDFQFEISSPLKEDFNITGHDPLSPGVAINSMEKIQRAGRAVWVIKGTYGPGVDERNNGATMTFQTDLENRKVEGRVIAFVKGPLTVEPGGFIALGHIPVDTAKSKTIKITPTDDYDLQTTDIEIEGLQVPEGFADKVIVTPTKDGKSVVVEIKIAEGMPRSTVRGKVKVMLNHPAAPVKEFLFNGFVR
ncbi:MAG: DUF1573 domain-containing protein [Planctomycetota bacterium]